MGVRKTSESRKPEKKNYRVAIVGIITKIEGLFDSGSIKATLPDYVRLIQLERELVSEEPVRSVVVQWNDRLRA